MKSTGITLALAILLASCDSNVVESFEPTIVVESYHEAGKPFGQVRLGTTAPVADTFDLTARAISDADVQIVLLDQDGALEETYVFSEVPELPGVYRTLGGTVQPLRTYRLEIVLPSGEQVMSTTTVPGAFEIVYARPDTVVYQGPVQFEVDVTQSFFPGRQSRFIFSTEGLEPSIESLTPVYFEIVDPDDDDDGLEDVRINESPPINEGNYDVNPEGTLTIRLPWLAVAFYGPNRIRASAVDDNLFDFARSQAIQQGGSTFSPGEIPNILDHIDGGTGVFGSYSSVITEVFVARPPGF